MTSRIPNALPTASTSCGADILLARHGEHIISWRVDSRTDSTLAQLDDGRWVSARNHLDLPHATPGRRIVAGWVDYKQGKTAIKPDDVRWMTKLCGWWLAGTSVIIAGTVALIQISF